MVPRLRLARIAALPNRAHGETWRRIADVERACGDSPRYILHPRIVKRLGLGLGIFFRTAPSLVVRLVVGVRWGGGGEKGVAAQ